MDTTLSIFTKDPTQKFNKFISIVIKGERGYGDHELLLPSRILGDGILFNDQKAETPLFPIKGSHTWFPFDNLEFKIGNSYEPAV